MGVNPKSNIIIYLDAKNFKRIQYLFFFYKGVYDL